MFQSTLTGKVVMFQEHLMIASKPHTMVGNYGTQILEDISYQIWEKNKKGKKSKSINQAMNCLQIKYNSFD